MMTVKEAYTRNQTVPRDQRMVAGPLSALYRYEVLQHEIAGLFVVMEGWVKQGMWSRPFHATIESIKISGELLRRIEGICYFKPVSDHVFTKMRRHCEDEILQIEETTLA
jgi:hypothetical protein